MRANGIREDAVEEEIEELGLTKDVATLLVRKYPETREFFENELVGQLMEPEPQLLTELIPLGHTVDPPDDEGAFELTEEEMGTAPVLRQEARIAQANKKLALGEHEKKTKKEKLTPRMQEQKRIEYQKMRTLKKQRKK